MWEKLELDTDLANLLETAKDGCALNVVDSGLCILMNEPDVLP